MNLVLPEDLTACICLDGRVLEPSTKKTGALSLKLMGETESASAKSTALATTAVSPVHSPWSTPYWYTAIWVA